MKSFTGLMHLDPTSIRWPPWIRERGQKQDFIKIKKKILSGGLAFQWAPDLHILTITLFFCLVGAGCLSKRRSLLQ